MAHGNQLLGQEGDDALGPAVKPGGTDSVSGAIWAIRMIVKPLSV